MYDKLRTAAARAVWLLEPKKLEQVFNFLDTVGAGYQIDAETVKTLAGENRNSQAMRTKSAVGVIPVYGTISQRVGLLDAASGGTSTESIAAAFDELQAMDEVGTIMAEFDSPGGTYPGIPELANKIAASRGGKPLIAMVNSEAGSGALWLASAFDEVVITPSGSAGSVGAYMVHTDESALNETIGVKREYISYGEYKTEGNRDEPMSDETRAYIQGEVDRVGREFETALARFRGLPVETIRKDFGRGRMLDAKRAVAVGMADKIATMDETVSRFATGRGRAKRKRVESAKQKMRLYFA